MHKKNLWLALLLIVLATTYAIFFSGWFTKPAILIHYTARPSGFAMRQRRDMPPIVTFGFDISYRLSELKVVAVADLSTNASPQPLWHLITDSNSLPVESFRYGQMIRGMRPAVPGAHPQPLEPNQLYRLLIRSGKMKGQRDFSLGPPALAADATNAPAATPQ